MPIRLIYLILSTNAFSHSGGVKKTGSMTGCHNDYKNNDFHCHSKSKYNGKSWGSEKLALDSIGQLGPSSKISKKYNRKDWAPWRDFDKNCLDTRHELLKERSKVIAKVVKCRVKAGKWDDFYFNEELERPQDIDIDHVVPIAHAHENGASDWPIKQKREFYNDMENLVLTNKKYNRQKGSKDFTQWLPLERNFACKYAKKWFYIKNKYKLHISSKEEKYYQLLKCSSI